MLDVGEKRIRRRRTRILADQLLERLVRPPQHLLGVEGGRDAREIAHTNPGLKHLADLLAPAPAVALIVEVQAEAGLEVAELAAHACGFGERAPLARGEREHHHAPAVAGDEIATERPVHMVAETSARLVLQHRLADEAEVTRDREPDIRKAELDQLAP